MKIVIDGSTFLIVAGMTYALISEGAWGAALMFFNALFAAIITLNFYEPLAGLIASNISALAGYADALCILLIFPVSLLVLRLTTESLSPVMIKLPTAVYHVVRIVFGLGGAAITAGVLLLGLNASPVHKKILGVMDYQHKPFYGTRFDRDLLAFFQYTSGAVFSRSGPRDAFYGQTQLFDPKGDWLIRAQEARPYGEGEIIGSGDSGAAAEPAGDGADAKAETPAK